VLLSAAVCRQLDGKAVGNTKPIHCQCPALLLEATAVTSNNEQAGLQQGDAASECLGYEDAENEEGERRMQEVGRRRERKRGREAAALYGPPEREKQEDEECSAAQAGEV
jgi:hypothetical protein